MERYKLEKSGAVWAIYDIEHPEYREKLTCQVDFPWVIAYWEGVFRERPNAWVMTDFKQSQAEKLLALLNGKEEQAELSGRNLEFGDEIEFKMIDGGRWHKGLYCGINERCKRIARSAENNFVHVVVNWRWPARSRIRCGQPLVVGVGYIRNFAKRDRDDMYVFTHTYGQEKVDTWRLPTKRELQNTGLGHCGWLTEDE